VTHLERLEDNEARDDGVGGGDGGHDAAQGGGGMC